MASKIIQTGSRQVKPILSLNSAEARRRVLTLYKAWYRQIPVIAIRYEISASKEQCRERLRELFLRNKHVTDIRIIDGLVIKGQMELVEAANIWKTKGHIMRFFDDFSKDKPTDFLSKFYDGHE